MLLLCCLGAARSSSQTAVQPAPKGVATQLLETGLRECGAYTMLAELTARAPHRLSGSEDADKAVALTRQMMHARGFDNVHCEAVKVPHWVRGTREEATIIGAGRRKGIPLSVCALGGSIATPNEGIAAEVLEVRSFAELRALGDSAKGRIIFFNRPFEPSKLNTFEAYGGAVDQRGRGAVEAAMVGGVAALVRSMTLADDDHPHTGAMSYVDTVRKVPAAALSAKSADLLHEALRKNRSLRVRLRLSCQTLPDTESANVIGQITGSEKPQEIVLVGGHLDCWDKGQGAHDDASGCMQAIEALDLIRKLGLKPKRTIRAVMFMNEENGNRGGRAYAKAPEREEERHIAVIESDRGGFAPRGLTVQADSTILSKVLRWRPLFEALDAERIREGYSGVDVSAMVEQGVPGFGLDVESHRYFDYHHSDNDTIDNIHPRELEMGAIVEALLCYLISEEGL